MLESLDKTLEELVERDSQKDVGLFEWVKDAIMIPTTDGIYGHANPYRQASARKEFWSVLSTLHYFQDSCILGGGSKGYQ